ncbi:hypothetical protein E2I00_011918 [Balaenoptera physalus]|uniref:SP-RING-type domain-containing protein n=1 Tax=Balaenoptera physalus TaxID=9770 RepID=A0A643BLC8_BALPH|nr:hypothetical protein E2I00_011918 [Balaenoptera physalus]
MVVQQNFKLHYRTLETFKIGCSDSKQNASDNSQRFRETCFAFALTPQQVQQISSSMDISGTKCDFTVQVQLRFCLSETSCPQEDHFPPNLCVKGYLPPTKNGVEPKRPSRPINITSLVRLSTTVPNTIVVSWTAEIGRPWHHLEGEWEVKEKLTADPDSEIATTSLRVSLLCPLGKMRLTIPCRALTCSHLQCFDATLYIQMNEKKPTWVCPVCDKKAPYEHLIIDGLFMEILKYCTDCDEIQFKEDGSWAPMRSKKEVQEVSASYNGVDGCLSSTLEHQVASHHQSSNKSKKVEVIDLTIDSSSDEEEEEPSAKRTCPSLSPTSPLSNKGILSLPHQASPVSRTPSLPAVDTSYINTSLIQDYRHPFHMTPMPYDLQGLDFFPFLSGDNQHYNTSLLAAAAAAVSDDQDLLHSSRFFPYTSSQMFLDQLSAGGSTSLPTTNGSSSGSNSSLVSSNSLRESHSHAVANRSSADTASIFGIIPDIISLD